MYVHVVVTSTYTLCHLRTRGRVIRAHGCVINVHVVASYTYMWLCHIRTRGHVIYVHEAVPYTYT